MPVSVGDHIPEVELMTMTPAGPRPTSSRDALGSGRVVLVAVLGAFTPTCSDHHLPGFVMRAAELAAKGVDTIACVSVNDAFVMSAWADALGVGDTVLMLSDGNGALAAAMGLEVDGTKVGMGIRSRRYAAILDEGIITELLVEPGRGLDVSSVESVLARL